MSGSAMVVGAGQGEALRVLDADVRFLCRAEDTGAAWSLMENVIPRNAGPPPHSHAWDEAYYLISGEVEFEIAGEPRLVRAGDFVYAPGGTVHAFRGASDEPARMLIFDAPAHAEAFFKDIARAALVMPRDAARLPAIGAAHGIDFIAPAVAEA